MLAAPKSRKEADSILSQIAHNTAMLETAIAARDKALYQISQAHNPLIETLKAEIETRRQALEFWATENRPEEFGEAKTLELTDGKIFFRQGQRKLELLKDWTWDQVLEKLLTFEDVSQWAQYVKRDPEINKALLLQHTNGKEPQLPESRLKTIGVQVTREERFNLEVRPGPNCFDVVTP